jgi:hypothetical protein
VDQRPETSVVEIVNVTVRLTPAQVVSEVPIGRIEDDPAVKGGRVLEGRVREEGRPMKYIGGGEIRHHSRRYLTVRDCNGR